MGNAVEYQSDDSLDYSELYKTESPIMVIKKDGSLELFNINKVVYAVAPYLKILLFE